MTTAATDAGELLGVAEIAKRTKVGASQVRRWLRGIRVGGIKVRLAATACFGAQVKVSVADLAAFEQACRAAKFGDDAAETVPVESPARQARRGAEAKARLAKLLEN